MMDVLAPLAFASFAEAQKFTFDNACALCRANLVIGNIKGEITVLCPEHGQMYSHTTERKGKLDRITSNETAAKIELNQFGKTPRDAETILKELGF